MAINIRDLQLNERIERLAKRQPTPLERAVMARSILDAACAACEQTGNPLAWMGTDTDLAAPASLAEAQQNTDQPSTLRDDQPNEASRPAMSDAPAGAGNKSTPKPRANAA